MNESDWKLGDPEWVKRQKKKWQLIKDRLEKSRPDPGPEEAKMLTADLALGYDFLFGKVTELPHRPESYSMGFLYFDWILIHPNPTSENINLMLDDFRQKGYTERLPQVHKAMELSAYCEDLVAEGVVDESVVEEFMNSVYGHSIDDTLEINSLKFDDVAVDMLNSYLVEILSWLHQKSFAEGVLCLHPIDRWVKLVKSLFVKVSNEHVKHADRALKRVFDILLNFENTNHYYTGEPLSKIPKNRKIVDDLRFTLIQSKEQYCSILKQYVNELEAGLYETSETKLEN
ncbi:MAG: hypothetical protein KTR16_07060 [Acidiferrobacterales bacterium]|nr:hypothetical protein [Acidiferrobacterales bacterium]